MGTIISGVLEILCHFFKMKQTGDDPFTKWNIAVFIHPLRIHSGNANDMYIFIGQSYFLYLLYKEGDYYATENPFTCDALSKWIEYSALQLDNFLFSSRIKQSPHIYTRQYARLVES